MPRNSARGLLKNIVLVLVKGTSAVAFVLACWMGSGPPGAAADEPESPVGDRARRQTIPSNQFGGSSLRNNVVSEEVPGHWDIESGKNIKWVAELGSQSYGTPVVSGGKVFIGTNNGRGYLKHYPPRHDLGVLLCLDAESGEFLWQFSREKLSSDRVHDRPYQGICSTPIVEEDRLWVVTNRGEVVCLDTQGYLDGEDDGPRKDVVERLFETVSDLSELAQPVPAKRPSRLLQSAIDALLTSAALRVPSAFTIRPGERPAEWFVRTACREGQVQYRLVVDGPMLLVMSVGEDAEELLRVDMNLFAGLEQGRINRTLRAQFRAADVDLPDSAGITRLSDDTWRIEARLGGREQVLRLARRNGRIVCDRRFRSPLKREADVVWSLDMMDELGVRQHAMAACSPTIWGEVLFVCTGNGVDEAHIAVEAPNAPSFVALDKRTGRVLWKDASPGKNILHGQWSSPAVGVLGGIPQVIFAGGDGWVYSFRADRWSDDGTAEPLWKFDANPKESEWQLGGQGSRNSIVALPVIHRQRVYVAVGQDPEHGDGPGHLWCIDPTRRGDVSSHLAVDAAGRQLPPRRNQAVRPDAGERQVPNPNSAAVWHYVGHDFNEDGRLGTSETLHRSVGSPVIADDLLFLGDLLGIVHCLDAATGKPHWTCDLLAACWATPLAAGPQVYVGDEDGDLAILNASPEPRRSIQWSDYRGKRYPQPLRESSFGSPIYSTPVASDGVLYVSTRRKLYAIAREAP